MARLQPVDTAYLKALYDRCIDMDESKADSVAWYAGFISKEAVRLKYDKGDVLSLRLRGIAEDLKGNYDVALTWYLQSLDAARKLHSIRYEMSALNDLGYVYVNSKQPEKAKEVYLQCAKLAMAYGIKGHSLVSTYINMGGIYNMLLQHDSALFFLQKGLAVATAQHDEDGIHSIYNNIGNVYYRKKDFAKAMPYFQRNYRYHLSVADSAAIWLDQLNLADDFIELKNYDSASIYAQRTLSLAQRMHARSKEADSYAILAKLFMRKGEYKKAYENQQQWYDIDTSLVNESTNKTMTSLQERFNAKQREQDNRLLMAQVTEAELQSRITRYLAIGAAVIALLIGVSLYQKRQANRKLKQQNDLIKRQNEKLAELNYEKNSLISIVSHDLSSPFSSIGMWCQVLEADLDKLTPDQQKAVQRIRTSTQKGESLIRTILDVEKAETNKHMVQLENFNLSLFVENVVEDFRPSASGKNINLHCETPGNHVFLVSDKLLVARICENLLSNALKYTPPGKNVWISLSDEQDAVNIKVKDEGVGIEPSEMPHLFSKYSNISSLPTSGEASTGLGLSIVKRIVQELNGSILCESEPGKGSLFTIILGK